MPDTPQIAVSPNNPCPFLRALVANGYVGGHIVPLSKLAETIEARQRRTGAGGDHGEAGNLLVALIANGLSPVPRAEKRHRQARCSTSCATVRSTSTAPVRASSASTRRCIMDEIDRLATFGKTCNDPAGGTERGLTAKEIDTFMAANLKRAGDAAHWYYPMLMKGEWPVLLDILGKGEGDARYLSVAEVRTLFVERRLPDRIVARLPKP